MKNKADKYLVMNASTLPIVAQHDGGHYSFKPGETKEITNFYTARHLTDRWKDHGIVGLAFGDREKASYGTFERYCLEKEKEGLDRAILRVENTIVGFDAYENEAGDKQSVARNQFRRQRKDWENILGQMQEHRAKLDLVNIEEREKLSLQVEIKKAEEAAAEAKKRLMELSGNNTTKSAGRLQDRDARS